MKARVVTVIFVTALVLYNLPFLFGWLHGGRW